jgi:hypothetical protein
MDTRRQRAEDIYKKYTGVESVLTVLGSGAEGFVFLSPSATAIKVFTYQEKFLNELAVYRRLKQHDVVDLQGVAVPRLVEFDPDLLLIEMTTVQPPYLLDFAQASLDEAFDFPEGGEEEWWKSVAELFDEKFPIAQSVFYELRDKYGIY